MQPSMSQAIKAGVVGAASLNILHETARQILPNAPVVHKMAMRATQKFVLDPIGAKPSRRNLYLMTLAGDLISNSIYYAAVVGGSRRDDPKSVWTRAVLFGLGAGALTVILPPLAGLGQQPSRNFAKTATMTTAWYLIGSLAAAAVFNRSASRGRVAGGDL